METPSSSASATRPKPSLPPNYVTLKQLQELRLKEKRDEEERRLRELKEAQEKKATKQRPPKADEVEEVYRNPPRGHQLLPAFSKPPSPNPKAERARSPDRSHARERTSAKQWPRRAADVEKARRNPARGPHPAVPKPPYPNPKEENAHSPDGSHPTIEVVSSDENIDGEPRRRGRRKRYDNKKGKRGAEEETKTATSSAPIAPILPLVIPVVPEKNIPEEKHRAVVERVSGGNGRLNQTSGRRYVPSDRGPVMVWVRKP